MADVKWIKITTDIFDDEKILLIESLPDAYSIIVCWFKLLCMAGKQNNSGVFLMGKIAYTDKMLATIFRMKEATVQLALRTFEEFGMIEIIDGVITIPNWGKHQSLDKIEARNERQKNYMREYRQKQKAIAAPTNSCKTNGKANCKTNGKANVSPLEGEGESDKKKEKEKEDVGTAGNLPAVLTIPLNDKSEYPITEKDVAEWQELYPAVDIMQELRNMRGWCNANPTRRKTSRGIMAFINRWLSGEQDKGGNRNAPQTANDQWNGQYQQHGNLSPASQKAAAKFVSENRLYMSNNDRRNSQFEQEGAISDMGLQDIQSLVARGNAYDPE